MKPQKSTLFAIVSLALVLSACQSGGRPSHIECGGPKEFICPSGMFCKLTEGCGGIDQWGVCARIPVDCPNVTAEVCGCDKKTYASACYANASLQTVAYEGQCL